MNLMTFIQRAVRLTCSAAIALMSTIVFIQVINRNLFGDSFKWVEELSTMCMVWITFLGAALAVTYNAHTRIELFVDMLPKRLSKIIFALGDLVCAVYAAGLCWYSYPLITANLHTMSPAMKLPLAINYAVFFAAAILIAVFFVLRAREDLRGSQNLSGSAKEDN